MASGDLDTNSGFDGHPRGMDEIEDILKRHLSWIQSYVHRKLGDFRRSKADTGDIVQEALIQFLRYGPRFHLAHENQLRALLCRIVEGVLCDQYDWFTAHRRSMAREQPLPSDTVLCIHPTHDKQETPSRIAQRNEEEAWIRLGIELLKPNDREIVILHQWENLSFMEISKLQGISKAGARKRYVRAMDRLIHIVEVLQEGRIDSLLDPDDHSGAQG